jgi:hypothetical protein
MHKINLTNANKNIILLLDNSTLLKLIYLRIFFFSYCTIFFKIYIIEALKLIKV